MKTIQLKQKKIKSRDHENEASNRNPPNLPKNQKDTILPKDASSRNKKNKKIKSKRKTSISNVEYKK